MHRDERQHERPDQNQHPAWKMTQSPAPASPDLNAENLRRVLKALSAHRTPGWHLPAHFLELHYDFIEADEARVAMPVGPHCLDRDGAVHRAAITVLADVAMGGALRVRCGSTARLATVSARLNFANPRPAQQLQAIARCRMVITDAAVAMAVCSVDIHSEGERLCSGESTFVILDNRRGTASHPLPRASTLRSAKPLELDQLTAEEATVLAFARRSDSTAQSAVPFLEAYWGLVPKAGEGWAECVFERGMHVCNRVGDVQGGVLLGLAAQTSAAVLSDEWRLIDASARYLAAADTGRALHARAETVRMGRNIAFTECKVTDESGRVALLAECTLARKAGPA